MSIPTDRKGCSFPGCTNTFPNHYWGALKAQNDGWFLQRNDHRWCPDHIPDWVSAWRESNK